MAKAHGLKYVHDLHCEKCDLREETNQLFFTISLVLASVVEPEPEPEPGQSWTGSTTLVADPRGADPVPDHTFHFDPH